MSSFRLKLIAFMVIAVVTAVFAVGFYSDLVIERFLRDKAMESQRYNVHAVSRAVTDFITYHAAAITLSARQQEMRNIGSLELMRDEFRGFPEHERLTLRLHLKEMLRAHPEFNYLNIYTPDKAQPILGEPFAWQKGTPLDIYQRGFTHRDWYKGVVTTQSTYISEVYATAQGPLVIAIAAPVFDTDGPSRKMIAIHGGTLRLGSLDNFLQSLSIGQTGFCYIVDKQGKIVAHGVKGASRDRQRDLDQTIIAKALQQTGDEISSGVFDLPVTGTRIFASYKKLAESNWFIIAQQSEQEALADVDEIRQKIFFAALLLILIAAFAIPFTIRYLTAPLELILRHLRSIQDGNFSAQMPQSLLGQKDEFGRLARTITDMQKSRSEVENELRESEQRYRAITQQSTDSIALADITTGRFLEVNERWSWLLGYNATEAQDLTIFDINADMPDEHEKTAITELPSTIGRLRRKTGHLVEVEHSASFIQLGGETVLLFVARDLSTERSLQATLHSQVKLAANIQAGQLPADCDNARVALRTIYSPYHVISGDFFDYAWNQEQNRLSGFILDVSGHGVASSLQGVAVSTYFHNLLDSPLRLAERLRQINRHVLHYFTDETYAAAIFFELDFTRQTLSYATAGIYAFLAASGELPVCVKQPGSLVGISETPDYQEYTVSIQPGDNFYFMSDGIFEQIANYEEMPLSCFAETLQQLQALAENSERHDDCSALCIHLK